MTIGDLIEGAKKNVPYTAQTIPKAIYQSTKIDLTYEDKDGKYVNVLLRLVKESQDSDWLVFTLPQEEGDTE